MNSIPSEIVKIVCNGDIDIISKLNPNSKQVIYNMLMEITRKMNPKITFGKGKREVYDNIMAILRSKTVFSDVVSVRDIRNYMGQFAEPDLLELTNNFTTCYNGFSFSKNLGQDLKKTYDFGAECMANKFIWFPNLLKNYPQEVKINSQERKVLYMIIAIRYQKSSEPEWKQTLEDDFNKDNNKTHTIYVKSDKIFVFKRDIHPLIMENNDGSRNHVTHFLGSYIPPHMLKISISLCLKRDEKEKKDPEIGEYNNISFPESSGFKPSSKRWINLERLKKEYDDFTIDGDFIGFVTTNFKPFSYLPSVDNNLSIRKDERAKFLVNRKHRESFVNKIVIPFRKAITIDFKEIIFPQLDLKEDRTGIPFPYDQPFFYYSDEESYSPYFLWEGSDMLRFWQSDKRDKRLNKILKNKLFLGSVSDHDVFITLNKNFVSGPYYPCLAIETKKVLTFKYIDAPIGVNPYWENFEDLFIDDIKSDEERKGWTFLWDELYKNLEKEFEVCENLSLLITPIAKKMGLTFESAMKTLTENFGTFSYTYGDKGGWTDSESNTT